MTLLSIYAVCLVSEISICKIYVALSSEPNLMFTPCAIFGNLVAFQKKNPRIELLKAKVNKAHVP